MHNAQASAAEQPVHSVLAGNAIPELSDDNSEDEAQNPFDLHDYSDTLPPAQEDNDEDDGVDILDMDKIQNFTNDK